MTTLEDLVKWRRDLHKIPEIGFQEKQTTQYLKDVLIDMGYHPLPLLDTGLLVYIDHHCQDTLAFRSDIDALEMNEDTNVEWCSTHKGFMHGCGHDGHMAALLGLAKNLKEIDEHHYNYLLIFQPGEELSGGAKSVIETGCLDQYHVKAIFGMHLSPDIDHGKIACRPGPMMAQSGELDITVHGKSAHAGKYQDGIDAIVIASELVCEFQSIVSRTISPFQPVVLSIGKMNGGTIRNIVANEAVLQGTVRCYDEAVFDHLNTMMEEICRGKEKSYHCTIDYHCQSFNPPVLNHKKLYQAFLNCLDQDEYEEMESPVMLAEDYAHYQKVRPGIFFFLGTKTSQYQSGLHTGTFNFKEEALIKAVELYTAIAKNINLGEI